METWEECTASFRSRPEVGRLGPSLQSWLPPLTRLQRAGLLGFLFVSAVDVVLSALLFFGGGGGYVEANPVLAWASEGLLLFLVAVLAVKAIGAGVIALLVSFANRFCTLAGDAVLFAALCTTTALFVLELVTVGAAPALLTIDLMIPFV
jgi:energy-converting hydrogenase Eha subunit B